MPAIDIYVGSASISLRREKDCKCNCNADCSCHLPEQIQGLEVISEKMELSSEVGAEHYEKHRGGGGQTQSVPPLVCNHSSELSHIH